ncbi:hypothetical protein V6N12_068574 [Hibiscus sabdariffa]|uniref:Uncharacterized protein n=1 Tax=Hibiscus sabdariffa TaxID=183260 RepID=A0ABR2FR45_9ROSI
MHEAWERYRDLFHHCQCTDCQSAHNDNHDSSECVQNPESSYYVGNYNRNTMSNTYNPTWKKHPNFSWQNQNNTMNLSTSNQQGYQSQPRQNQ